MGSTEQVYEATTTAIVRAIDEGAETWEMPWSGGIGFPMNAVTLKRYRGGNVLSLWGAGFQRGFSVGAQIRRGESGTGVLFWSKVESKGDAEATEAEPGGRGRLVSGHSARLDRGVLSGRFASDAYAAEELVAELSTAFTCATIGPSTVPRPDHAAYLHN